MWIMDCRTMGRVVKVIAPRSFVVETQEGNFRRNRRALVLMPKDQDERGGEMSEEEETADEQGKRRVEDERDVAEEEKQVDTDISNREPQDKEEKDEEEKHADTEISKGNLKMRKRKAKATWKTRRHGMLKIHAWRGKRQGWNPKKSM